MAGHTLSDIDLRLVRDATTGKLVPIDQLETVAGVGQFGTTNLLADPTQQQPATTTAAPTPTRITEPAPAPTVTELAPAPIAPPLVAPAPAVTGPTTTPEAIAPPLVAPAPLVTGPTPTPELRQPVTTLQTATGEPVAIQLPPGVTEVTTEGRVVAPANQNEVQTQITANTPTAEPLAILGKPARTKIPASVDDVQGPFPGPNPFPIPPGTEPVLGPVPGMPASIGLPIGIPSFGSLWSSPTRTNFQALPVSADLQFEDLGTPVEPIEPGRGIPSGEGTETTVKNSVNIKPDGGGTGNKILGKRVAKIDADDTDDTEDIEDIEDTDSLDSPAGFIFDGEAGNRFAELSVFGDLANTDFFGGRNFTSGFTTSFALRPEDVEGRLTDISKDVQGFGSKQLPTITAPGEEGRPEFNVGDFVQSPVNFNPIDPADNPILLAAIEKIMLGVNGQIPGFETQAMIGRDAIASTQDVARQNAIAMVAAGPGLDSGRGQAMMRQFELGILSSIGDFENQLIVNRANLQRGYIDAALNIGKWQQEFKSAENQFGTKFAENKFWREIQYYDNRERFGVTFAENQYLADMDTEIRLTEIDQNWKLQWASYKDANVWASANYGVSYSTLLNNTENMVNNWVKFEGQFKREGLISDRDFAVSMDEKQVSDLLSMVQTIGPMMPEAVQAGMLAMASSVLMGVSPGEAIQIFQDKFYEGTELKDIYKDPSEFDQWILDQKPAVLKTINKATGELYTEDEAEAYLAELFTEMELIPLRLAEKTIDYMDDDGDGDGEPGPNAATGGLGTDDDPFVNIDEFDFNPFGTETVNAANLGNTFALDAQINEAIRIEDFSQLSSNSKDRIVSESVATGRFDYDILPGDIQEKIDKQGGPATTPWNVSVQGTSAEGTGGFGRFSLDTTGNSGLQSGRWMNLDGFGHDIGKVKLISAVESESGRDHIVYTFLLQDGKTTETVDARKDNWGNDLRDLAAANKAVSGGETTTQTTGGTTTGSSGPPERNGGGLRLDSPEAPTTTTTGVESLAPPTTPPEGPPTRRR